MLKLPHNLEIEKQIIGMILMDEPDTCDVIFSIVSCDDFYSGKNQDVVKSCHDLYVQGKSTNLISVRDQLSESFDHMILVNALNVTVSTDQAHDLAQKIKDYSTKRKLIVAAQNILTQVQDVTKSSGEIITEQDNTLFKLLESSERKYRHLKEISIEGLNTFQKAYHSKTGIIGIPTHFQEIDNMTAGLREQDLIYIAASTSVGKTALAIQLSHNIAAHGTAVGYFSLEMSANQIWMRLASLATKIDSFCIQTGRVNEGEAAKIATCNCYHYPIFVDDTGGMSVAQIRNKARLMVKRDKVKIIFIDHVGFVTSGEKAKSRNEELTYISARLKALAKELDITVVALCQLNRNSVKAGKAPELFDLRDSGSLEQDADLVFLLYRPEKIDQMTFNHNGTSLDTKGMAILKLEKNRNGKTDQLMFNFDMTCGMFTSYDIKYEPAF